jgi:hypothetical protein
MYEALQHRTIRIKVITGEINSPYGTNTHKKHQFSHSIYTGRSYSFLFSAVITGVQMGEMSKLGSLIGWSSRDMWADYLYFLYKVFASICKTFAYFQHILWPSSYSCWLIFIFQAKFMSGYICAP